MEINKIEDLTDKELLNIITNEPESVLNFLNSNPDLYQAIYNLRNSPEEYLNNAFKEKLAACLVFSERLHSYNKPALQKIYNSGVAALYLASDMQYFETEQLVVLSLNENHEIIGKDIVAVGTNKSCPVSIREIFMAASKHNASKIIVAHNHPSGSIEPGKEDNIITRNLHLAGNIMNIPVLDHIIIGKGCYYSFSENQKEKF